MKRSLLPWLLLFVSSSYSLAKDINIVIEDHKLTNSGPFAICKKKVHAIKGNLGYRVFLRSIIGEDDQLKAELRVYDYQCALQTNKAAKKPVFWKVLKQNPNPEIAMKYYDTWSSSWRPKNLNRKNRTLKLVSWDWKNSAESTPRHFKYFSDYQLSFPAFDSLSAEDQERLVSGETLRVKYVILYQYTTNYNFPDRTLSSQSNGHFSSDAFRLIVDIRLENHQIVVADSFVQQTY